MLQSLHGASQSKAEAELRKLQEAAIQNRNMFSELMEAVKSCSLGQLTKSMFEVGGQYRRNM
jgi:methylmalonyl-CoA mutase